MTPKIVKGDHLLLQSFSSKMGPVEHSSRRTEHSFCCHVFMSPSQDIKVGFSQLSVTAQPPCVGRNIAQTISQEVRLSQPGRHTCHIVKPKELETSA